MQLVSFEAHKVHGVLDFKIDFFENVNFLVGGNGCGKTTIIKLVTSLFKLDLKALIEYRFESLLLTYSTNSGLKRNIQCFQSLDELVIITRMLNGGDPLVINRESIEEDGWERYLDERDRNYVNRLRLRNEITLIGLIRTKSIDTENKKNTFFWLRGLESEKNASPLDTAKYLIVEEYKRLRVAERNKDDALKTSMLKTIFTYTSFDDMELLNSNVQRRKNLRQLRDDAEDRFTKTGLFDDNTIQTMAGFFDRMENAYEDLSKNDPYTSLEYLMNKGHLERIEQVIDLLDDNKKEIEDVYAPLNLYIETVNSFFNESGKRIEIDKKGDLECYFGEKKIKNLEVLSSGEQQILVLMTILAFQKGIRKGKVFLIDEPELSLHLFWQHKFVKAIQTLAPTAQFILATHSPEILSGHRDKAISVSRG